MEAPRQAIAFGDVFVDNATRAAADDFKSVDAFKVWGNVAGNTGNIFLYNGANVTRDGATNGSAFKCDQTECWIPKATYNFLAISGANSVDPATGAFPTEITYEATGSNDLLISEYVQVMTDAKSMPVSGVNDNDCVPFTFSHLLSKVYFKFTNTSLNDKCKFVISDIKISGAKATSTYDIENEVWADATGTANDFTFGNAGTIAKDQSSYSDNACLFIPGAQTLTVTFTQQFLYNGEATNTPETITATLNHTFAANGCYVINVELEAGATITFTTEVVDRWDDDVTIQ